MLPDDRHYGVSPTHLEGDQRGGGVDKNQDIGRGGI